MNFQQNEKTEMSIISSGSMTTTNPFSTHCPLSCVLAGAVGDVAELQIPVALVRGVGGAADVAAIAGTYRQYLSAITSNCVINNQDDVAYRSVRYLVGRAHNRVTDAFAQPANNTVAVRMAYPVNQLRASEFGAAATKSAVFSTNFGSFEFAGVVERLAVALACLSLSPENVTTTAMRGGNDASLVSLAALKEPVAISGAQVYIPNTSDRPLCGGTLAALIAAINGCGATVITDYVTLNAANNAVQVPDAEGGSLHQGIFEALALLGTNMIADGAGIIFSYALTRGIHKVLTVVGHTDEGSWIRRVFRNTCFAVPYGAIKAMSICVPGLPRPRGYTRRYMSEWTDSIALASAALVNISDPMLETAEGRFPTVLTIEGNDAEPGTHVNANNANQASHAGAILDVFPAFAKLYFRNIAKLFCVTSDDNNFKVCETAFILSATITVAAADAHLNHAQIVPFDWIEPTSLLDVNYYESYVESEGFSLICSPGQDKTRPFFEDVEYVGGSGVVDNYHIKLRSAKTSGCVMHLQAHARDGNANIKFRQMDPFQVILPGGADVGMSARLADENANDIGRMLWVRGHSGLPGNGELLVPQYRVGVSVTHMVYNVNGVPAPTHFPNRNELLNKGGGVTFSVTRPTYATIAVMVENVITVRRNLTRAGRIMNQARHASRLMMTVHDCGAMPVRLTGIVRPTAVKHHAPTDNAGVLPHANVNAPPQGQNLKRGGQIAPIVTVQAARNQHPINVNVLQAAQNNPFAVRQNMVGLVNVPVVNNNNANPLQPNVDAAADQLADQLAGANLVINQRANVGANQNAGDQINDVPAGQQ